MTRKRLSAIFITALLCAFTNDVFPHGGCTYPTTPALVSPTGGATCQPISGVTLTWQDCSNETSYRVYFEAEDPTPDDYVTKDQDVTSHNTGALEPDTTYYWKVRAINSCGSRTSAVRSFTTSCTTAVLDSEVKHTMTGLAVTFDASGSVLTEADRYIAKYEFDFNWPDENPANFDPTAEDGYVECLEDCGDVNRTHYFDGIASYAYEEAGGSHLGEHIVGLRVTDSTGYTSPIVTCKVYVHRSVAPYGTDADYDDIQDAIDAYEASWDDKEVWVAPGTYKSYQSPYRELFTFPSDSNGIILRSIDPDDPEVVGKTIITDGIQAPIDIMEFDTGIDSTTKLLGFTIAYGSKAIYCNGGSPTIENCIIRGNYDGIYNDSGASPVIENCIIRGNSTGIYNDSGASPTIENCVIRDNSSRGVYNKNSASPTLLNCVLSDNGSSINRAGGMVNNNEDGGGDLSVVATNCIFSYNESNFSGGYGGGIHNWQSELSLVNCTFAHNTAITGGGAIYNGYNSGSASITMRNCILWNNQSGGVNPEIYKENGSISIAYSDIKDCYDGETWDNSLGTNDGGNIDADPNFANSEDPAGPDGVFLTADDGLRLQPGQGSPCIDQASDDVVNYSTTDITGRDRIDVRYIDDAGSETGYPDMGAYETPMVWFVRKNTSGGDDGKSWDTAFDELSSALDPVSENPDLIYGGEIWVSASPSDSPYLPGDERTDCFEVVWKIAVYGGFPAEKDRPTWLDRDWQTNETVLSGDIDAGGNPDDDSYHVVMMGPHKDILDGFTITGGCASGSSWHGYGGGIYCYGIYSTPVISNCKVVGNYASEYGGGMYNSSGTATVTNCTFSGNYAGLYGGGMYNRWGAHDIENCLFLDNIAGCGGGMYNRDYSPKVSNCVFAGNRADVADTDMAGGAIYNTEINENPEIINCVFYANTAANGGAVYNSTGSSHVHYLNCTFYENTLLGEEGVGASMYNYMAYPTVTNCIFWNSKEDDSSDYAEGGEDLWSEVYTYIDPEDEDPPLPSFRACNIKGSGGSGENWDESIGVDSCASYEVECHSSPIDIVNMDEDPMFVDSSASGIMGPDGIWGTYDDGLQLNNGSPCIDVGDFQTEQETQLEDLDIKGQDRVLYGYDYWLPPDTTVVDIGAYEHFPWPVLEEPNEYVSFCISWQEDVKLEWERPLVEKIGSCQSDRKYDGEYDVYFGTSLTDGYPPYWDHVDDLYETIYADDGLEFKAGTTYYWAVRCRWSEEPKDCSGYSQVWSFRTAPAKATLTYPQDEAEDVPLDSKLQWEPADTAVLHAVYLGTDAEHLIYQYTQYETEYDPGGLEPDKEYYWRIDEIDENGCVTEGETGEWWELWNFHTGPSNILQGLIDEASLGEVIILEPGVYVENVTVNKNITIKGADTSDPSKTVIKGHSTKSDPIFTVASDVTVTCTIEGVTVINEYGPAIECGTNSDVTITNSVIRGSGWSDGVYSEGSALTITNCTISDNGGNGIEYEYTSAGSGYIDISGCTISNNSGAGIYLPNTYSGDFAVTATIRDCILIGNGGGIELEEGNGGSTTIERCVFYQNKRTSGGGIKVFGHANHALYLKNCVFSSNEAMSYYGGAIYYEYLSSINPTQPLEVYNCTFTENKANYYGGALYFTGIHGGPSTTFSMVIYNSIFWDDVATTSGNEIYINASLCTYFITLENCRIAGDEVESPSSAITIGDTCFDDDPLFADAGNPAGPDGIFLTEDDGLQLQPSSPCVDIGTNATGVPATDILEASRINMPGWGNESPPFVDVGAYEAQVVWHVDKNVQGGDSTGLSWENAFDDLQEALDDTTLNPYLEVGHEIWVADGTYEPGAARADTFQLVSGVEIYGGFAGNETSRYQRDWKLNETILSGDIDAGDLDSYHVVTGSGTDDTALLDGFTITGGNAALPGGGGMYNNAGSPTVVNCAFKGNYSLLYGAGVRNRDESQASFENCTFEENEAKSGAAVHNDDSNCTFTNCTFNSNISSSTTSGGGGMANYDSDPALTNCTFTGNTATKNGGGIYNSNSVPVLTGVTFTDNSAEEGGAVYNCVGSEGTYSQCVFVENSVAGGGGGIYDDASSPALINCLFWGNEAADGAGMFNAADSNATLINCTLVGNEASNNAGSIYNDSSNPILTNSILWGNLAGDFNEIRNVNSSPTIKYSCIEDSGGSDNWDASFGVDEGGNIDVAPRFADPNNPAGPDGVFGTVDDGLRPVPYNDLQSDLEQGFMPTYIDSADSTVAPDTDITGRARVDVPYIVNAGSEQAGFADMGAYEAPVVWYVNASAKGGRGRGWSWETPLDDLQKALEVAESGDEIWVAKGVYTPGADREDCFHLTKDKPVAIYGGFSGTKDSLAKRDWIANETILSGEIGYADEAKDNCLHVVRIDCDGATLDGLTIRDGCGIYGGGIYIDDASARITNCVIRGNYATGGGGGICVDGGSPTISNCIIINNRRPASIPQFIVKYGGGLRSYYASPIITGCLFTGNRARYGGGMWSDHSDITVTDCVFRENKSNSTGGGLCSNRSSVVLTNCLFTGNHNTLMGGGISLDRDSPATITNCTVAWNSVRSQTPYYGAGLHDYAGNSAETPDCIITNSIFYKNVPSGALQIYLSSSGYAATISYCDIEGGCSGIGGTGGYTCCPTSVIGDDPDFVDKPEFYDRTIADGGIDTIIVPGATVALYRVGDIIEYGEEGQYDGQSRVVTQVDYDWGIVRFEPPLGPETPTAADAQIKVWGRYALTLYDDDNDKFNTKGIGRLQTNSPCIDTGLDDAIANDIDDIDGDGVTTEKLYDTDIMGVPRFQDIPGVPNPELDDVIDMGAFECGGLTADDVGVGSVNEDTATEIDLAPYISDMKGGLVTYEIIVPPRHGTCSPSDADNDDTITYTPAEDYFDADGDLFSYKATDGINLSEIATVTIGTIASQNDNPVANDDVAWINEAGSITIDVLANDEDPEGVTLTIASGSGAPQNPPPSYGTLAVVSDNIQYTVIDWPNLESTGYDEFIYKAYDSQLESEAATVRVNVNNKPDPDDDDKETERHIVAVVDILANDSDGDDGTQTLTVTNLVQTQTGPNPDNEHFVFNEKLNLLLYWPDPDAETTHTYPYFVKFTYKVEDEFGLESDDTAQVDIKVLGTTVLKDSDGDGLSDDDEEELLGTDKLSFDSDGDGVDDGKELSQGTDPSNPFSGYFVDRLPYVCRFLWNQDYKIDESLDGQCGWEVDQEGDCQLGYKFLYSYKVPGTIDEYVRNGAWVAKLNPDSDTATKISKAFDDKGEDDDLSNVIRIKLYPANNAEVKIYSDTTVIAGIKFFYSEPDVRKLQYWDPDPSELDWLDSGETWDYYPGDKEPLSDGTFFEHYCANLLKFEFDFTKTDSDPDPSGKVKIYWDKNYAANDKNDDFEVADVLLRNLEDLVFTSNGMNGHFSDTIKDITRIEFGTPENTTFEVRGVYIHEADYATHEITYPHSGDNVQESRIPIKGHCSVNASTYLLRVHAKETMGAEADAVGPWLFNIRYFSNTIVDPQFYKGAADVDVLGYWNTGVLPSDIYHVVMTEAKDFVYEHPSDPNKSRIIWYRSSEDSVARNVATSGFVKNNTFRHEEVEISVPWPGEFGFECRRIYDSGRGRVNSGLFPGWTNNNQIILTEYADYYESSQCEKKVRGEIADKDDSGLAFGAIYVQYEDGSTHMFRHRTGTVDGNEAVYTPYPDDGSGDYIIRTTEGYVAVWHTPQLISDFPYGDDDPGYYRCSPDPEENGFLLEDNNLTISYELNRSDGTKLTFYSVEHDKDSDEDPIAINVNDCHDWKDECEWPVDAECFTEYYPKGGAVYSDIGGGCEGDTGWHFRHPDHAPKWRFVTAVDTKSDRYGNTLHYTWNENKYNPLVNKVSYNDGTEPISIELEGTIYGYDTILKVNDDAKRTVYHRFADGSWWLLEVSTEQRDDATCYYYGPDSLIYGIFDDFAVYTSLPWGYCYRPPWSALKTLIWYDSRRNCVARDDYVDYNDQTFLMRDYWYYFLDPDSGNEEDGQCVFKAVDYRTCSQGVIAPPHRTDISIINEKGQLRVQMPYVGNDPTKLTNFRYTNTKLPFTPTEMVEYWDYYDPETELLKVAGRKILNTFRTDRHLNPVPDTGNPDDVNACVLDTQKIYDMGRDIQPGTEPEGTLVSYTEKQYHPYPGYNWETESISYQHLDQAEVQHEKPVRTQYVYRKRHTDGTYVEDTTYPQNNRYLWKKRALLDESPDPDLWAETEYNYEHRTGPGLDGTVDTEDDTYALTKVIEDYSDDGISDVDNATIFTYDNDHRKKWVKADRLTNGTPAGEVPVERFCYDDIGQLLLKADTYGLVTKYHYNDFGDVEKIETFADSDALKTDTTFEPATYDNFTPRSTTEYEYDHQRRRITEKTQSQEKKAAGIPVAVKRTEYIGAGLPSKVIFDTDGLIDTPDDSFVEYFYDGRGLKLAEKNYDRITDRWWYTDYFYDNLNRNVSTVWWDYKDSSILQFTTAVYNGPGEKALEEVWALDAKGRWQLQGESASLYDGLGRMTDQMVAYDFDEADPLWLTTSFGYDDAGNQTAVTDPKGSIIYTDYDNANRKTLDYFAVAPAAEVTDLVSHWTFDEGAGDIAYDSAAADKDGSVSGAIWTAGRIGRALSFDGDADNVEVPGFSDLLGADYSLSFWVKPNQPALSEIIVLGEDATNHDFEYYMESNGDLSVRADAGSEDDITVNNVFTEGQWVHICGVGDSTGTKVYVNGVLADSTAVKKDSTSGYSLNIGSWDNHSWSFDGIIDDVLVYDRALNEAEINMIMNAGGGVRAETEYYENGQVAAVSSYDYDEDTLAYKEFDYDSRKRIAAVIEDINDSNTAETTYAYEDANDSAFTVDDQNCANVTITRKGDSSPDDDIVTQVAYNELGKVVKTVYPSTQYQQFTYNGDGTLMKKKVWDAEDPPVAHWVEYDYDQYARVEKVSYPPTGDQYIEYTYDGLGRVMQIDDQRDAADCIPGTITYENDPLGRLLAVTGQDGYRIDYSYRADGQKQRILASNPAGEIIYKAGYEFDLASRLKQVVRPSLIVPAPAEALIAGFGYDDNGNRKQLRYYLDGNDTGDIAQIGYKFNRDNMLINLTTMGTIEDLEFALYNVVVDGLGRLVSADEILTKTDQTSLAHDYTYVYDMRSQLTRVDRDAAIPWREYSYNKNGNMSYRKVETAQTDYGYTGERLTGATNAEIFSVTWDENGDIDSAGHTGWDYEFNWDNKLRKATKGSDTIEIKYDPQGNRIYKETVISGQNTKRKYIVDIVGDLPVILLELDASTMDIEKTYIYANSQILAQHDGDQATGDIYFYLHDRLGSVRQIIDDDGLVVMLYTYDPFGEVVESDGSFDNAFRFTGQYYDDEIEQYYLRARQYDPKIHVFTSRDLFDGVFEQPLTLHKYLYCINDPINFVDPQGLDAYYLTGGVLASLGFSFAEQMGITWDDEGNWGIIGIESVGGGSLSASVGINFGITNAETILRLRGPGRAIGGGFGVGFGGGAEVIWGRYYYGLEFSVGLGVSWPAVEVHAHRTQTYVRPVHSETLIFEDILGMALAEAVAEADTYGEHRMIIDFVVMTGLDLDVLYQ